MAKIKIRTIRTPYETSNDFARKIKLMRWGDDGVGKESPDTPITIGEFTYSLKMVEWVDFSPTKQKPAEEDREEKEAEAFRHQIVHLQTLSLEQRACELNRFKLLWFMATGESNIDLLLEWEHPRKQICTYATVREMAEKSQLKFFRQNPRCPFAGIKCFQWMFDQRSVQSMFIQSDVRHEPFAISSRQLLQQTERILVKPYLSAAS